MLKYLNSLTINTFIYTLLEALKIVSFQHYFQMYPMHQTQNLLLIAFGFSGVFGKILRENIF